MADQHDVHAPYNFIPFSDKILVRYKDASELPGHDVFDPNLKTGEIHVTLTAETPVFVSNGKKNDEADFFRGPNGKYMIPGSTVRGMLRENVQILGFGLVRKGEDLDDNEIFFREIAAASGTTGDPLKQRYKDALDIRSGRSKSGKTYSTPEKVKAGYLCKTEDGYVILPVEGSYIRISREDPLVTSFGDKTARAVPVAYELSGEHLARLTVPEEAQDGMKTGVLLYTGKPVGRQKNPIYLFPPVNKAADPVKIPPADVISYQADWESRKNALRGGKYDPGFWALPEDETQKPVFYTEYAGHIYFGMTLFPRVGYGHSLAEGLPEHHRATAESDQVLLDYAHSIFGFAGEKEAYRSRVSVGDFCADREPAARPFAALLGEPKPSYYPGYVKEGGNYTEEDFQLRGYKQYWMKAEKQPPEPANLNASTWLRPMPTGTNFKGVIRFRNLAEDELGLLLWAIRLEMGCRQNIGMGKPYGYGQVKAEITDLLEYDAGELYESFCAKPKPSAHTVDEWIDIYDQYAAETLGIYVTEKKKGKKSKNKSGAEENDKKIPTVRKYRDIRDFMYMKTPLKDHEEEASYMALAEYKNTRTALVTVQKFRENQKENEAAAPAAKQSETAKDDWSALLGSRFKPL